MGYKNNIDEKFKAIIFICFGLILFQQTSAQKFWLTTGEFPGGPKTGITMLKDSCLFSGISNGIIRSCNDGRNFEVVLKSSAIFALYSTKEGKLLAGGNGRLFYSDDSGNNWDSVSINANFPVTQIIENKSGGLFAITGTLDIEPGFDGDGVFYSEDDGHNWSPRNNGLGLYKRCERIAIDKNERLYLTVADDNFSGPGGLYISENNGNTWEHIIITIDGKDVIPDQIQVGNTLGLSISPFDSVYLSFTGSAINVGVSLNVVKSIEDIRKANFWKTYQLSNSFHWWNEQLLNNIHFAQNGDCYSSVKGSVGVGATYFMKNKFTKWEKIDFGLGLNIFNFRDIQYFAEKSNGKVFMVQLFDERIYQTDTSLITAVEPLPYHPRKILVYPNPAGKGSDLSINVLNDESILFLSVVDATGREVLSGIPFSKSMNIAAPEKPGLYFIVFANKLSTKTVPLVVH